MNFFLEPFDVVQDSIFPKQIKLAISFKSHAQNLAQLYPCLLHLKKARGMYLSSFFCELTYKIEYHKIWRHNKRWVSPILLNNEYLHLV